MHVYLKFKRLKLNLDRLTSIKILLTLIPRVQVLKRLGRLAATHRRLEVITDDSKHQVGATCRLANRTFSKTLSSYPYNIFIFFYFENKLQRFKSHCTSI